MSDLFQDSAFLSLSQLAHIIKTAVWEIFPDAYWVKAEIAKMNYYPQSGHCYPDLVEKKDNMVKAQMRATIWAGNFKVIRQKFLEVTREDLREGLAVLILAQVTFHEVYGLSLNIIDIEPSFTLGEMAREKRDAIEKLKKEGVFESNKKLSFPVLPKRIAIISVDTSKGYSDLITTLRQNRYGYVFLFTLFPAILQGEKATGTIRQQLKTIETMSGRFDVVAIIRGGGDEVGLTAYDHYELAREVAICPLPVITGIGHSTNETVVEMVSHTNMITPTAVAEFLIRCFREFEEGVDDLKVNIAELVTKKIEVASLKLNRLAHASSSSSLRLLERKISGLQHTKNQINIYNRQFFKRLYEHFANLENKIKLLDPSNVLKRGYSITYLNGKPLTDSSQAGVGEELQTQLLKGTIISTVKKTEK